MLDAFTVFTKRGLVLFNHQFVGLKGNPVDKLVRNILLEDRGGDSSYTCDNYLMKWTFANEFDLIFVVVYQKILSLLYIEELLAQLKAAFCELLKSKSSGVPVMEVIPFESHFMRILDEVENSSRRRPMVVQKTFMETSHGLEIKGNEESGVNKGKKKKSKANKKKGNGSGGDDEEEPAKREPTEEAVAPAPAAAATEEMSAELIAQKRKEFLEQRKKGGKKAANQVPTPEPVKMVRGQRKWGEACDVSQLDKSIDKSAPEIVPEKIENLVMNVDKFDDDDDDDDDDDEEVPQQQQQHKTKPVASKAGTAQTSAPAKPKKAGFLSKYFAGLTGNNVLEEEDLEPVLVKFKQHLMEKNVASEIADKLCQSVGSSLAGKKLGTFQGVSSTVKTALEEALTRIMTPKRQIDILREVEAVRGKRPYTITFCGVNGVGKSTNLAKITAWLMQNNLSVMIAACDTFRSGAVEQLRTHVQRLKGVQLFERGYGKDAAGIAGEAIANAKDQKIDVVLIDTAGRMQDNEPLMRSLAKLVNVNAIDLVLFVGEALVGNDGVDQLVKFNKALADLSTTSASRLVDGIILTKFDTIDDKVGAAISMVYSTGQPIVFLGTGQHYTDLKKMNVGTIIKTLLA